MPRLQPASRSAAVLTAGLAASALLLTGCQHAESTPAASPSSATSAADATPAGSASTTPTSDTSSTAAGAGTVSCSYPKDAGSPAKPVDPPSATDVPATGTTSATLTLDGQPVTITLDRVKAPCTVNNFVSLAKQKYFDGTSCHRLVTSGLAILQCGDPTGTGNGGPGYAFADELASAKALQQIGGTDNNGNPNVVYPKASVAMANAGPGTNGSQFFLVFADTQLGASYTLFGTMDAAGEQQVAKIAAQGIRPGSEKPVAPAKISQVTLG